MNNGMRGFSYSSSTLTVLREVMRDVWWTTRLCVQSYPPFPGSTEESRPIARLADFCFVASLNHCNEGRAKRFPNGVLALKRKLPGAVIIAPFPSLQQRHGKSA